MSIYNIVAEGADNDGNTPIDGVLEDVAEENATIIFPSGTYKLDELVVRSGVDDLKLIAPNGARLVPGQSGDSIRWIDVYSQGFVMDGFELDMRNTPVPPFVRMNYESGDWELKRLVTRGKVRAATDSNVRSNDSSEARTYFRLSAAEGTRGLLQDCYFHEGACEPDEASNRRAILVESGKGELVFNRCWFELWAENTMYAKKLEGPMKVYNCFQRNTQNGMRLGGNTEVRNCVSIKDDKHPIQAWSGGALQRGINAEGSNPTDSSRGISSHEGTLTIADCDFYHRYPESTCGGPITGPTPVARIDVQNVRISYQSHKSHDAIYTLPGRMNNGEIANLEYLRLRNIQVENDHPYTYAVSIDQTPDEWGEISGVLGGSGRQTDSSYVRDRVTTNGDPIPPNTQPPLLEPPELGQVPLQSAQLVKIDNQRNDSEASYLIRAGSDILPAGDDNATIAMDWGSDNSPVRPPDSKVASGEIPPGEVYTFYVTGGIVFTSGSGSAKWSVDRVPFKPNGALSTNKVAVYQPDSETWHEADLESKTPGITVGKPLSSVGWQPAHVRLRNTTDSEFAYKLEEWNYLDGAHSKESFSTISIPPGEFEFEINSDSSYRVRAGTISTSDEFTTKSLNGFFGSNTPVVLTQCQSINGSDPVVTRLRGISSDEFEVKVQKSEASSKHHVEETIGYIALEQTSGYLNGKLFEVQRTAQSVTDDWFYIPFEKSYSDPQFIADLQTYIGSNPSSLRYRNLSSNGVEVKVEEAKSEDSEVDHTTEVVGYAVFEGSPLITDTISSELSNDEEWNQFKSSITSEYIIIAKPLSVNGWQPAHVRLRETGDGSIQYQIEEWDYLDGNHSSETFHTLATQAGDHELSLSDGSPYLVKAGTVMASDEPNTTSFENYFSGTRPIVFAQAQTHHGSQASVTRLSDITSEYFTVRVQEEQAHANGGHDLEAIGYIALEEKTGELNGKQFEVSRTDERITDKWSRIAFEQKYDSPQFISDIQTYNGSNTCALRYRNLSSTGVEVKIEEEQSIDDEMDHGKESIGFAVFES
ncbi:hypothetical protein [Haladaptatus sp. DYF46]|uniref:hypothetical protein n=1 Tax=Haladaptatus sp. DYF46 TaxID=2886041 RepID=UPI001E40E745|nr:hypothetical protein [Haladaptatus sp. DYF46]